MPKIHYICNAVILDCNSIFNQNNHIMRKTSISQIAAIALATAIAIPSCTKEEYNLDNIGHDIMFETGLSAPLIQKRDIWLADFFHMNNLKGKFQLDETQAQHVKNTLGENTNCLEYKGDGKYSLILENFNGDDFESLQQLGITVDNDDLPHSDDFIEIDDLDEVFGEDSPINEINEFTIVMEIDNNTDFKISLSVQFAKDKDDKGGTKAENENGSEVVIDPHTKGNVKHLTFKNIANEIKNTNGLLISYKLEAGDSNNFTIRTTNGLSMGVKAYLNATIDLSRIN